MTVARLLCLLGAACAADASTRCMRASVRTELAVPVVAAAFASPLFRAVEALDREGVRLRIASYDLSDAADHYHALGLL